MVAQRGGGDQHKQRGQGQIDHLARGQQNAGDGQCGHAFRRGLAVDGIQQ